MHYRLHYPAFAMTLVVVLLASCINGTVSRIVADGNAAYCTHSGGTVESRSPYYGTNGSDPLRLAGSHQFCRFTAADHSKLLVSLDTLYAEQPTLAALAYQSATPLKEGQPSTNPSSLYCSQLGGTDQVGGVNAAGGGWAVDGKLDDVVAICVFPDFSAIDSWGLTYHSNGTIRGADLSQLFRFQPMNQLTTLRTRVTNAFDRKTLRSDLFAV